MFVPRTFLKSTTEGGKLTKIKHFLISATCMCACVWFIVKAVWLTFKSSLEYGTSYASLFLLLPKDFPHRAITDVVYCTVLCQPKEYNDTHVCCWDCMYISFLTLPCWSCMEWCHTDTQTDGCTSAFLPCLAGVTWSDVTHTHTNRCTTQGDTHVLLGLHVHQPSYLVLLESHGVMSHRHTNRCTHTGWYTCVAGTACTSAFLSCRSRMEWCHADTQTDVHTQDDTHVLLGLDVHQLSHLVLLESHGVMWHAESSFGVFLHLT